MRTTRLAAALAFSTAILLPAAQARQSPPAPQATPSPGADHHDRLPGDVFRVQPLSGDVYALYGRGGNVGFFVGPEAVLVVDSQFKDIAPGIVSEIRKVSEKPIKFLLNTHHHGDHVGGNEVFKQFAMIVAHDNVRKRMLASPTDIQRDYPALLETAKKAGNAQAVKMLSEQIEWAKKVRVEEIAAPILTFDSELRIHMGDETIQVWHLPPAHTDGDSVVYFEKAKVLHMGDDLFNKVIPFIDIKSGGSVKGYLAALDRVVARVPADAKVIPGHGEVTDVAGIKAFRQYIADLLDAAGRAKAAGKSKDDFVKDVDLPAYKDYQGYKDRFKANAGSAYDEVR
ncbi:MAG TPA: MBL fold metallo-hydrolase [Thermoanaerobaculia bacterium]|nr:MBL fold metallo-hydrolase [Thermoanaerobaculia bacterium]